MVLSAQAELLKAEDVNRVMHEIMDQHVNQKQVTKQVLKKSFKVYFDQFDSGRVYLLDEEVSPFLQIRDSELNRLVHQYEKNDLSEYEKMHDVIQKSIDRARLYRQSLKGEMSNLLNAKLVMDTKNSEKIPFANSTSQLKERIRDYLIQYIETEKVRLGEEEVAGDPDYVYAGFDKLMRQHEDQYLYTDPEGNPLNPRQKENLLVIHVLKSLAKSLDSHTRFFNPSEAFDMRVRLEKGFQGIGVVLEEKPEGIQISRLIKGGPAEKSGEVKEKDFIVKVNGLSTKNMTLSDLIEQLRSNEHSKVNLVLSREENGKASEKHVSLMRELVAMDEGRVDIEYEKFDNGIIGKLTLHSFYQGKNGITSERDLRKAIEQLQGEGNVRGLIIDLRENSGGFLSQAVKVAGLFITNGVVVISKYSSGEEKFYRDMDGKVYFDGPIVVLTSKATASAAEIVAQALQDYGVAIVVGDEQTYGKGTIQSQTFTDDQSTSYFKVTVGKYYTVSGKTPQKEGVKADLVVPSIYNEFQIGEEFLEYAMPGDQIDSAYNDRLEDINAGIRPWYMRYYVPTLQERETTWKRMLPELKKKSTIRMSSNGNYQKFLREGIKGNQDLKVRDLQMNEAVNIIKDMIQLEKRYDNRKVATP